MNYVGIEAESRLYSPKEDSRSLTVGEMIEVLKQFNPEDKVYICLPGNRQDMYDITSEGRIYEDEV